MEELDWIDNETSKMVSLTKKWANINSYSTNVQGLNDLASLIIDDFSILKATCKRVPLLDFLSFDKDGKEVKSSLGDALLFSKRPNSPIQILLMGHLDTVFSPSSPFQQAIEKNEKLLEGPGVADLKGGLAIMLIALLALENSPHAQNVGWEILLNPDEEIGSPGSCELIRSRSVNKHVGLVFEPPFPEGTFVSERSGSANFSLAVKGKASHVGRAFTEGRHSIGALSGIVYTLHQMNRSYPQTTINIGTISGGSSLNIVPDFAHCQFNIRFADTHNLEKILNQLETQIQKFEKTEGVECTLTRTTYRPPKPFTPETEQLFEQFAELAQKIGRNLQWKPTGGVCDGNNIAAVGVPTIDTLGGVGGNIHTEKEYLEIPSLASQAKLTALYLLQLAEGKK